MPLKIENGVGYGFTINTRDISPKQLLTAYENTGKIAIDEDVEKLIEDVGHDDVIYHHLTQYESLGVTMRFTGDFYDHDRVYLFFGLTGTVSDNSGYVPQPLGIGLGDDSTGIEHLRDLHDRIKEQKVPVTEPSWVSWMTVS